MSGIKRLKSKMIVPGGCQLNGVITPSSQLIAQAGVGLNMVVRFFTAGATTEVGKVIVPATKVGVHVADDTTNTVTSADQSNLATGITLANEIKADYNAHRVSTTFHSNADTTNAVTSADATDQATLNTLLNEIKADYNAHLTQAGVHLHDDYGHLVTAGNATSLATSQTLNNQIKSFYSVYHLVAVDLLFSVYGNSPGTYDVGIKAEGCCSVKKASVAFTAGAITTVGFGPFYAGDVGGNESISNQDTGIVLANIGKVGQFSGYPGNWLVPEMTELGDWTVIPTARRRSY